ncbi:DUF4862 family protein [Streptomyces sp. SID10853]|uniref:DUF4862 family protein n=1 Tax=Streptomyces sp. SID10853 TaxID=2706028 RepID=UPI0013BFBB1E|nr:DUF4862 family protein [Streptomyces sp. SID10853]NDZ78358.1 DUF4862 family protein [Streptomyces sp. SID10853]
MNTARPAALVGAYAALPSLRADQERFYEGLAGRRIADGLEIPFRDDGIGEDIRWLAAQLHGCFTRSVITLIPGTMVRVGASGTFGLASGDQDGRRAAVAFLHEARTAAEELNQLTGEQSVSALHIHTAPSVTAVGEMFARSLDEIAAAVPASGAWSTRLVLEHCDAYAPAVPGEKRFLPLEDEIPLAREGGIGITINWGRSAVEAQAPGRPLAQIAQLASDGLLEGVMFSGAGPAANEFGGPWADAHLPLTEDEPTSLMDAGEVRRCLRAAEGAFSYAGAKIQVPGDATVDERLAAVGRVMRLLPGPVSAPVAPPAGAAVRP